MDKATDTMSTVERMDDSWSRFDMTGAHRDFLNELVNNDVLDAVQVAVLLLNNVDGDTLDFGAVVDQVSRWVSLDRGTDPARFAAGRAALNNFRDMF